MAAVSTAALTAGADMCKQALARNSDGRFRIMVRVLLIGMLSTVALHAAEQLVVAPGGGLTVIVSDDHGLYYRVEVKGRAVLKNSTLGLDFDGGMRLGPPATITKAATAKHDGKWENRLGNNWFARDSWRDLTLTLEERGPRRRMFGLIVRAYGDGVAFRYDLPASTGLGSFVRTNASCYSIYSINDGCGKRSRGISELGCLVSMPWTHRSFLYKRRLISQAGRRSETLQLKCLSREGLPARRAKAAAIP